MKRQREQALLFLTKAAEDETLLKKVIDDDEVSDSVIGFHFQQAAEKLLKARLSMLGVRFAKTHDLAALADLLKDSGNPLPAGLDGIDSLTPYAASLRYELAGEEEPLDRQSAEKMLRELRTWVEAAIT